MFSGGLLCCGVWHWSLSFVLVGCVCSVIDSLCGWRLWLGHWWTLTFLFTTQKMSLLYSWFIGRDQWSNSDLYGNCLYFIYDTKTETKNRINFEFQYSSMKHLTDYNLNKPFSNIWWLGKQSSLWELLI